MPVECAAGLYDAIMDAGADLGLKNAGYYALESLRLEKGYRAWGRELTPDDTPLEAGLEFATRLDKAVPFLGRDALLRQKETGVSKRLVLFTLEDEAAFPFGDEPIFHTGKCVGWLTSTAFGHTLGCAVGMGYVRAQVAVEASFIESGAYEIEIAGTRFPAKAHLRALYDPANKRVRA